MPDIKETCAHKLACRQKTYPDSWQKWAADACDRETYGTLADCSQLVKMDCGHEKAYLRLTHGDDFAGDRDDPGSLHTHYEYCLKCKKEATNATV